jgi:cytidylate kinase
MAREGGVVLEGRDIGTVVFPTAELKIFMVADINERARRRKGDLARTGVQLDNETVTKEIVDRDTLDSTRTASPLKKADDAIELDTSGLTIEEQVGFIVKKAMEIMQKRS